MKLTNKQRRFCEEYLIDLNATQSAIRAGYSEKTAGQIGEQNLKKLEIQSLISILQEKKSKELNISQNKVLNELCKVAFGDVKNYFDAKGNLIDISKLENQISASIKSITVQQDKIEKNNKNVIETSIKKIESYDKLRALDTINKMLGYYAPIKQDHTTNGKDISSPFVSEKDEKDYKDYLAKKYNFKKQLL